MSKEPIVIEEKKAKDKTNKICAILYTITTVLWMITIGLKIYGYVEYGAKLDCFFFMGIALTAVFGSLAVIYFSRYKKQDSNSQK